MERSTSNRVRLGSVTLLVLPLVCVAALDAQTFGEITGRISDASSAVVATATVTVTNVNTNAVRTTLTNDDGDYSLPSMPPGFYSVKVEHQGFKTGSAKNIEVQVQQTVRLDFTLQVGQVSESIEVSAAVCPAAVAKTHRGHRRSRTRALSNCR